MQEDKVFNRLLKHYHENTLAHAFLIETNHQEKCYQEILSFLKMLNCENGYQRECKKCNLCHLLDKEILPSFLKIVPDGSFIKKEQVLELKRIFQTKPIFSKYNMYIILNAETLNSSSANTLLKFVEEPPSHVIGFFITNNKENVIDTIKSRCQIYSEYYQEEEGNVSDWEKIAIEYVLECEISSRETLLYNKDVLLPKITNRLELKSLFQSIFSIYEKLTFYPSNLDEKYSSLTFVLKKGNVYLQKRIKQVSTILEDINYNLNISLLLDRFVLEGGRL